MITLNEAHNMNAVLETLRGVADEVFLVDSFSQDKTVAIAQEFGVRVVQRPFKGFGDQWNFAVNEIPITAKWTMKLDPDERITPQLASSIRAAIDEDTYDGFTLDRQLWFMGAPMPVRQRILRIWRTGICKFTDVLVNEHPIVEGNIGHVSGDIEHHDSPDLHHWFDKQNRYTTAEAQTIFEGRKLAATPSLFGCGLERRMWLKRVYRHIPFRHALMFLYCWLWLGAWRSGRPGFIWARLRATVFRMREDKLYEMRLLGASYSAGTRPRRRAEITRRS
ncbi:MAG: glycosyltransferase family 2 protein [Pseudomonadota bacterium]